MASSLESSKKGTPYAYAQGSGNGGKKKPTSSRVQSGPLRHAPAAKTSRYSPVTSRREQRVSPPQPCHGGDPGAKSTSSASAAVSDRLPSLLEFSEVKGDLFSCPSSSSLAHCVSEDLAMGRGVAVLFKKQFGGVGELRDQGVKPGGVAVLKRKERFIYYLVTKKRYFHKPTYESLRSSLEAMRAHCMANGVQEICMPRIGCGLDKLEWGRVTAMIQNVFRETELRITVYYL